MSHKAHIIGVARELFARDGFLATSVQDIADTVGSSKATVLYHFPSKDALLDAVLEDAMVAAEDLLQSLSGEGQLDHQGVLEGFVVRLVDLLIAHRHALHIVITHVHLASSLPAIARARKLMADLSVAISGSGTRDRDSFRVELALSGATFTLVAGSLFDLAPIPESELRDLLHETVLDIIGHPVVPAQGGRR